MWYKIQDKRVELSIYAKPNAKKSVLVHKTEEALHIALQAKPQEGAANKELIAFIAKLFKIPKTQVTLIRGEGSRHKRISIPLTNTFYEFIKD